MLRKAAEEKADEKILIHIRDQDCVAIEVRYHKGCYKKYTDGVYSGKTTTRWALKSMQFTFMVSYSYNYGNYPEYPGAKYDFNEFLGKFPTKLRYKCVIDFISIAAPRISDQSQSTRPSSSSVNPWLNPEL